MMRSRQEAAEDSVQPWRLLEVVACQVNEEQKVFCNHETLAKTLIHACRNSLNTTSRDVT